MSSRSIFQDVTNNSEPPLDVLPEHRNSIKRPLASQDSGARKKPKLDIQDDSDSDEETAVNIRRDSYMKPGKYTRSYPSSIPFLRSFVSSNKSDVFRCQSDDINSFLTPPYTCAYSHAAKRGGIPLLAVATEQGSVRIWETSRRNPWDPEPLRSAFYPHKSGIFDIQWNESDELLVTCCGDRTCRITSVATYDTIHTLRGHGGTVKCAAWDPNHRDILSTGGRDGLICVWDLRAGENSENGKLSPILTIAKAHETHPAGKTARKAPVPKSVTGVVYNPTSPHELISSGSSDGVLRCWDIRCQTNKKKSKPSSPICVSPMDSTLNHGSRRPRGLLSLQCGVGPTAGLIFSLGTDSRIHTYSLPTLESLRISHIHPNMQITAFYVGLALSPCGQWLAAGSVGTSASSFLFDVSNAARPFSRPYPGVQVKAPRGEVGAVDWGQDILATCADDGIVRVWRPDIENYSRCLEDPNEMRWDWSWSV